MELTPRQSEIYRWIRDRILNHEHFPTVREIGEHFEIKSPNGVMCNLQALEKKGYITRDKMIARSIRLSDQEKPSVVEWAEGVPAGAYTIINDSGAAVGVIRRVG